MRHDSDIALQVKIMDPIDGSLPVLLHRKLDIKEGDGFTHPSSQEIVTILSPGIKEGLTPAELDALKRKFTDGNGFLLPEHRSFVQFINGICKGQSPTCRKNMLRGFYELVLDSEFDANTMGAQIRPIYESGSSNKERLINAGAENLYLAFKKILEDNSLRSVAYMEMFIQWGG